MKISEVQEATPRRWEWPKGSGQWNLDYKVKIEGSDDWLVLTQKEGGPHPRPTVGQSLFAEIDDSDTKDGQFPAKLKRAQKGGGFSGGGGKSPEQQKAIVRQHSQEMALRYMAIKAHLGAVHADQFPEPEALKPIIEFFVKDAGS